ncbi:MAG: SsrA-binding protein SmpB [Myxococcota bacterium]
MSGPVGKKKKPKSLAASGTMLAQNRRALHEYHVLERFECGLALVGSEVKSVKDGKASLAEAFASFDRSELWLHRAHVSEYTQAHRRNHEPLRRRKLLMHRKELDKLEREVAPGGLTLIPLSLYAKGGIVKLELGLCRGKQMHDKRATIKEREQSREMDREIRERRR